MSDSLEAFACYVRHDPFFLAPLLAAYAASEGLDDAGLATAVGCRVPDLSALRVCRAPRSNPNEFREDIQRIADHFGLNGDKLTAVVRRSRALERLRNLASNDRGALLAAREADMPGKPRAGEP